MQILKAGTHNNTNLSLFQQEWKVDVDIINNNVMLKIANDFVAQGRVIFTLKETGEFVIILEAFFSEGNACFP